MKVYSLLFFVLLCFFLLLFLLVEHFQVPLLSDPSTVLERGGFIAALVGTALLISDILLPVPSSLIMIAYGALFGLVLGTLLSLVGGLGASLVGFWIGRRGATFINRFVSEKERQQADRLMQRWGMIAIIVTRPIPLLSEATSIVAGGTSLRWRAMIIASVLGLIPGAAIYAAAGVYAVSVESTIWSFVVVIGVAFVFWVIGKFLVKPKTPAEEQEQ